MKTLKFTLLMSAMALMSAVSAEAKVLSFGPTVALNTATYAIENATSDINNHMGYQAGVELTLKVPIVSLTPSIIYSRNSFSVLNSTTLYLPHVVTTEAITVPIVVGLHILGPLSIEAGPVITLRELNSAKRKVGQMETVVDDLGNLRSRDSYVAGLRLSFMNITAFARYNKQFGTASTIYGDMDYSSFAVGVGVRF